MGIRVVGWYVLLFREQEACLPRGYRRPRCLVLDLFHCSSYAVTPPDTKRWNNIDQSELYRSGWIGEAHNSRRGADRRNLTCELSVSDYAAEGGFWPDHDQPMTPAD